MCFGAWGQIDPNLLLFTLFHNFPKTLFAPKMTISMIWSSRSVLPPQNFDAELFQLSKKTIIFLIFNDLNNFNNFVVLGPRPLGPFVFRDFLKIYFMVWDLSRSVPRVFRSPGTPLINLFRFIFNSKCHFLKISWFIKLPIVLPIVLPIAYSH